MAGRFVRASKYRHVFGKPTKKEFCYDNLRISRNAWDTNIIKANPEYLSVNWEAGGGGAFAVIPVSEKGRLPEHIPLFRGHTAPVLDTDWNPFNDHLIASGSEDGKVFIWQVPKDFTLYIDPEESAEVEPVCKFAGHSRKVGQVLFNPAAENILASASGDYNVKLWDVASGKSYLSLKHHEIVQSLSWSANGSMLATTSRDKQLRVWDVRQEKPVFSVQGHNGAKNSRVVWMGEHNRLATTGFSKMSDRQMALWDVGNPSEPIGGFSHLDSISGVCMPFWDDGTQCLFLAGKGDGNIRYFEYENDKFEFLSEHKSPEPQRGIAFVPRRGINVYENEIMRAYKTVNDTYIEPISFTVPRRAEVFQADIYPPAIGLKPALSASEWLAGNDGIPDKIDLESVYEGNAPVQITPQYVAPTILSGPVTRVVSAGVKDESHFASQKKEPMLEQKVSISAIASKFQDDVTTSDDESSSFNTTSKPGPTSGTDDSKDSRTRLPAVTSFVRATPTNIEQGPLNTPHHIQSKPEVKTNSSKSEKDPSSDKDLQSSLAQIKDLLQTQIQTINSQSEQIGRLAQEVDTLKAKVGSGSQEQSERIQQLERELEAART